MGIGDRLDEHACEVALCQTASHDIIFGRPPRELTPGERALLVALPQAPERYRPDRHPEAARAGRNKVLRRMVAAGLMSPEEAVRAAEETIP
ncbi:MAG: transglycosylase domain-containing protein, partial [Candidatus Nanopelagicales bacterium]